MTCARRAWAAALSLAGLSACAPTGVGYVGSANPYATGYYAPGYSNYGPSPYVQGYYGPDAGFWGPGIIGGGGFFGGYRSGGYEHRHWDRDYRENGERGHWGGDRGRDWGGDHGRGGGGQREYHGGGDGPHFVPRIPGREPQYGGASR